MSLSLIGYHVILCPWRPLCLSTRHSLFFIHSLQTFLRFHFWHWNFSLFFFDRCHTFLMHWLSSLSPTCISLPHFCPPLPSSPFLSVLSGGAIECVIIWLRCVNLRLNSPSVLWASVWNCRRAHRPALIQCTYTDSQSSQTHSHHNMMTAVSAAYWHELSKG